MLLVLVMTHLFSLAHEHIPEAPPGVVESFYKSLPKGLHIHRVSDNSLGLSSSKPIKKSEASLCVPSSLVISSSDHFPLSPFLSSLTPRQVLITRLMYEKLNSTIETFAYKFVQSLQTEVFHFGSLTTAHLRVLKKINFNKADYASFIEGESFTEIYRALEKVPGLDQEMLSYSSYLWAAFHVNSKQVFWDEQGTWVLVPYIDLVRHYPTDEAIGGKSLRYEQDAFCAIASKDVKAGEVLFRDMGRLSSFEYFQKFGKVLETNPDDFFEVQYQDKLFKLDGNSICIELIQMFGDEKDGLRNYRNFIRKVFEGHSGLRDARRRIIPYQDLAIKEILRYGVEIRRTYYKHLRLVDTQLMLGLAKGLVISS